MLLGSLGYVGWRYLSRPLKAIPERVGLAALLERAHPELFELFFKPHKCAVNSTLVVGYAADDVNITDAQKAADGEGPVNKHWRTYFLQALAATSNVTASAKEAGVSPSRAYKARREHADFAADWRAALYEGYEHLEMEVLAQLRGHDPERKLDIANAIRLLAAHRQGLPECAGVALGELRAEHADLSHEQPALVLELGLALGAHLLLVR